MRRIEHNENKWVFPFVEYSPQNVNGKIPVIIQLHGAGECGNGGAKLDLVDIHGFSKTIKDEEYECMFIMPQCSEDTFWVAKIESILKFINQIIENYDIDLDRIYLVGLSMGGYGTWYTAMADPKLFAAIAPICGGGMAWNAGVLKMPIWVFHGAEDNVVTPTQSDEMVESLIREGCNVKYSRIENVWHNVWERACNDELIKWLLSQKRI